MTHLDYLKREHAAELQRYKNALVVLHEENQRLKKQLSDMRNAEQRGTVQSRQGMRPQGS